MNNKNFDAVYAVDIICMYYVVIFVFLYFSRNLDIVQRKVNRVLERLQHQYQGRRHPSHPNKEARANNPVINVFREPEENAPLLPNSRIRLGDRVRIMNPSRRQFSEGIVISTTESGGFILVKTRHVKPVRRRPKKLQFISSHHNNDNPQQ